MGDIKENGEREVIDDGANVCDQRCDRDDRE